MQLALQRHWLEDAIGSERDPGEIAQAIAQRPEFIAIISDAVQFAAGDKSADKTRVIAEHIAHLLRSGFNGFVTMH